MNTGFDFAVIRRELDHETPDDDGVSRVWLGTVFGVTPSGKVYAPFACSNVAGDCPVCHGSGTRFPRTGQRTRDRATTRQKQLARKNIERGMTLSRRQQMQRAHTTSDVTCHVCRGYGSISAARDERFYEALEAGLDSIGAYLDTHEDSLFAAVYKETEESNAA